MTTEKITKNLTNKPSKGNPISKLKNKATIKINLSKTKNQISKTADQDWSSKDKKNEPVIKIRKLLKRFRKFQAVNAIDLDIGRGVIHGFIGPNGAGKTTTIKMLIGAFIPTSGEILINGHRAGTEEANRLIGYIPERASFPKYSTAFKFLVTMAELSGLTREQALKRANANLKELGLEGFAKKNPNGFSSGMKKKLLLAQALMNDPKILILDEPAANLDPTARKELFDTLLKIREQGKTIFISSHVLVELERVVNEVTFLFGGNVIYSGTIEGLDKETNDEIFVKAYDNVALKIFLTKKLKLKVRGDIKTELIINANSKKHSEALVAKIFASGLTIKSIKVNDLQSIYNRFLEKTKDTRLADASHRKSRLSMFLSRKNKEEEAIIDRPSTQSKEEIQEQSGQATTKVAKVQPKKVAVKKVVKAQPKKPAVKKVAKVQPKKVAVKKVAKVQPKKPAVKKVVKAQPTKPAIVETKTENNNKNNEEPKV